MSRYEAKVGRFATGVWVCGSAGKRATAEELSVLRIGVGELGVL